MAVNDDKIDTYLLFICIGTHPAQAIVLEPSNDRTYAEYLMRESLCPSYNWLQFIWNIGIDNTCHDNNCICFNEESEPLPSSPENEDVRPDGSNESYVDEVIRLVNIERAQAGLKPLNQDEILTQAAETRCGEIINEFSHTRPDGSSCFTALQQAGASYNRAGENIAIGQTDPAQVLAAWMGSPGHRANIMDPRFSRIGVAVCPADGSYGGFAWAQFFAD